MQIHNDISSIQNIERPILTIGTFDGVHQGHRVIIDRLNSIAKREGGESVLLTFHPHPRSVVGQAGSIELLSTLDERLSLLELAGLDHVIIYPFTHEFSRISALGYVRDLLVNTIGVHTAVVGYDHHFGRNREGDISLLTELAEVYSFKVVEIDAQMIAEVKVSSTKVRQALREGQLLRVKKYLGYTYSITGKVVKGDGRGRLLGFPTANISPSDSDKLIPGRGVYAVRVVIGDEQYNGMLNIGSRPTFKDGAEVESTIEVHLFDYSADLYGQQLRIDFVDRLRDEKQFSSSEAIQAQLALDKEQAIVLLQ